MRRTPSASPLHVPLARALVLAGALLVSLPTRAGEEEPPQTPEVAGRTLGGHVFLFPLLQDTALVVTHVGIRLGAGMFAADAVPLGNLGRFDFRLAGLEQRFDAGLALTPWLALSVTGSGNLILGTNLDTLVARTGAAEGRVRGGLLVRLWRSDVQGTQVSLRVEGGVGASQRLTLFRLLDALEEAPAATVGSIFRGNLSRLLIVPASEQQVGGRVYLVHAYSRGVGLQASLGADRVWSTEREFDPAQNREVRVPAHSVRADGALALGLDAAPLKVPVALQLEYLASWRASEDARLHVRAGLSHAVGAGVYYSGRARLQLGVGAAWDLRGQPLEGTDEEGQPADSERPSFAFGEFILRYVW
ncbi:MAG: hypothetical protein L0Y66_06715 [Myxococcaceae bacterium]|nr:hypothetical protein [Myxococcaceae bacterium]